ncbi:MAG: hypothetical protein AAB647_03885 [Patescibacteria group bacterium]
MVTIIPAILSHNLLDFHQKLQILAPWAPGVHIDIADGQFVDNTTLTYEAMAPLLRESHLPIELHLMVAKPWPVAEMAADDSLARILIHAETITSPIEYMTHLADGWPLGLVFNLTTPWGIWQRELATLSEIMLMGIEPGWQGKPFDSQVLKRLKFLKQHCPASKVALDGGVSAQTIKAIVAAGADQVVVGSALWNTSDPEKTYHELGVLVS